MAGDNENNLESKEVSSDVDSLDWRVMHKQKVKKFLTKLTLLEAATRRYFSKKVLLKFWQCTQENTSVEISRSRCFLK